MLGCSLKGVNLLDRIGFLTKHRSLFFKMAKSGVAMFFAPSTVDRCFGQNTSRVSNNEMFAPILFIGG